MDSFPTSINYIINILKNPYSLIVTAAREIASSFSREVWTTFLLESTITCPTTPGKLFMRCRTLSRSMQKVYEQTQNNNPTLKARYTAELLRYSLTGSWLSSPRPPSSSSTTHPSTPSTSYLNPLSYSQRTGALRLLIRHFARYSKASQRLHIMPDPFIYISRCLHRRYSTRQERTNNRSKRTSCRSDQCAHLHTVMHYPSHKIIAKTFNHTISVRHIIHRSCDPNNAIVLLRQCLACIDCGLGRVR